MTFRVALGKWLRVGEGHIVLLGRRWVEVAAHNREHALDGSGLAATPVGCWPVARHHWRRASAIGVGVQMMGNWLI